MTDETTIRALKALADPTRLHIVDFLGHVCCNRAEVDDQGGVISPSAGEVCCHITGAERITSTISHHLHELEAAGLVRLERKGKTTLCSLRPERLEELAQTLLNLTRGDGNQRPPCC
jgi:DNA-binding transcriptional ArsR family regulator